MAEHKALNTGVIGGALASLAIGIIFGFPIASIIFDLFWSKVVIAITLGALYFVFSMHNVPLAHRGVVLLLGKRRPWGHDGEGVLEGLNWLPLPSPIMKTVDVDVEKKKLDLSATEVFTNDNVIAKVDSFLEHEVDQPYEYLSVENPIELLKDLALRAIRLQVRKYGAVELLGKDKKELSEEIQREIESEFDSNENPRGAKWGLKVGFYRVNNIRLDAAIEEALRKQVQEPIEGAYEQEQARRRTAQVQELVASGVDPNTAFAGALVDAEKPGAELKATSNNFKSNLGGLETLAGRTLDFIEGKTGKPKGRNPRNRNRRR